MSKINNSNNSSSNSNDNLGKIFICGAGPGDPKLLTIRALELINESDVILYDRLIGKDIIKLFPEENRKNLCWEEHWGIQLLTKIKQMT